MSFVFQEFTNAKKFYEDVLKKSGHNAELTYEKPMDDKKSDTKAPRKRKRNVLWYNPPFSRSVQTNIGKRFFALLRKHFGKDSRYRKLFNRNTVKLSYSCMPNIGMIIKSHNARLLNKGNGNRKACSCRNKS